MSPRTVEATPRKAPSANLDNLDDRIFVSLQQNRRIRVFLKDIKFVEARRAYCHLVTRTGDFLLTLSMAAFQRQLPAGSLLKVHRSYLVNLRWVEELDTNCLVIGQRTIPLADSAKKLIGQALRIIT